MLQQLERERGIRIAGHAFHVLLIAAAALVFSGLTLHLGAIDCNDGYQYVSIAENISNNGKVTTSLVHFDTERAHAGIPAYQKVR